MPRFNQPTRRQRRRARRRQKGKGWKRLAFWHSRWDPDEWQTTHDNWPIEPGNPETYIGAAPQTVFHSNQRDGYQGDALS